MTVVTATGRPKSIRFVMLLNVLVAVFVCFFFSLYEFSIGVGAFVETLC